LDELDQQIAAGTLTTRTASHLRMLAGMIEEAVTANAGKNET
jgi:hypothetical protein